MPDKTRQEQQTAARASASKSVHVLAVGPFGMSVTACLEDLREDIARTEVHDDIIPLPTVWPAARINVVAAWRPVPHLCDLLDQLSFERRVPFVPLIMHSNSLVLGPVVLPGGPCCWGCWIKRCKQHSRWPKEQTHLMQHYARDPAFGPKGYLAPFALLGAAKIAKVIAGLDSGQLAAGAMWQIDLLTREIGTSTAMGVHDCPRCGLHRPAETRGFIDILRDVDYLWNQTDRAKAGGTR